jgi:dTDP-4-dehydrorhamnose reductase
VNIIVLGARGMLGSDLVQILEARPEPHRVTAWDIQEIDITDRTALSDKLQATSADVVINCAAYTAVDQAEKERDKAFIVNALGARHVAGCAAQIGARSVLISTDYVFDGTKSAPYREDDRTGPINHYGHTKLMSERFAADADPDCLIVRAEWLYGSGGKNFVEKMLELSRERPTLSVVDDQHGSPTYTRDLALAIATLVEGRHTGTYHVSNSGDTTWYGFARKIFEITGKKIELVPISSEEFKAAARRPKNSVFDMGKLIADAAYRPRPWEEAIREYLSKRNS